MFYEAQVVSQELKRGSDHLDKQGHVYLYSEKVPEENRTLSYITNIADNTMRYIKYDVDDEKDNSNTFKKMLESNSSNIQEYFSINKEGQLVLATLTTTTVKTEGAPLENKGNSTTYQATEVTVDYKNMISQYATPMSFFLELGMTSRNPNFLADVVKMVKENTNIQLTVFNTTTTEVTTQEDKYVEHIRARKLVNQGGGYSLPKNIESDIERTGTTTTTITTKIPNVRVTSVDTWLIRQKIKYNKVEGTLTPISNYSIEQKDDPEKSLKPIENNKFTEDEVTWITREDSQVEVLSKTDSYDSGLASDYEYRGGENPDKDPSYESFVDLLSKEYKIPNSNEKRNAMDCLNSDAEIFFHLLQQNSETQRMELIMRYLLNQYYNDKRFGDIDFKEIASMFASRLKSTSGGDVLVNTYIMDKELIISDVNKLKEAIRNTYTGNIRTNLENNAGAFISAQNNYHVNAVFSIAVTVVESSGGTNWAAIDPGTYNWYSIKGSYNGNSYVDGNGTAWRKYSSYREAVLDFGDLIANSSYYFKAGKNSVKTIAPTYCDEAWGRAVIATMREIYSSIGISISGDASKVVDFALQYVGQGHSTFTSYKTSDGRQFQGGHWCAMFVSYCFDQQGLIPDILPNSYTGCTTEVRYLQSIGKFEKGPAIGGNYVPQAGDIIFFSWNLNQADPVDHTGIVTDCDGSMVYTVEGNSTHGGWWQTRVSEKEWSINSNSIYGYFPASQQ